MTEKITVNKASTTTQLYEIKTLFLVFQNRAIDGLPSPGVLPGQPSRKPETEIRYFWQRYSQGDWIIALSYGKGI